MSYCFNPIGTCVSYTYTHIYIYTYIIVYTHTLYIYIYIGKLESFEVPTYLKLVFGCIWWPKNRVLNCFFAFLPGAGNASRHKVFEDYVGTPQFMPKEVIENKCSDHRSDVWSLGCTIFQVLSGCPPFHDRRGKKWGRKVDFKVRRKTYVYQRLDYLDWINPDLGGIVIDLGFL